MEDDTDDTPPSMADLAEEERQTETEEAAPSGTKFKWSQPVALEIRGAPRTLNVDQTVRMAITFGAVVSFVRPSTYRVIASQAVTAKLAEWLSAFKVGNVELGYEQPPAGVSTTFTLAPARPPVRSAEVFGVAELERWICRAIDAGLDVRVVGSNRFNVSGPSWRHVRWMMDLLEVDRAKALQLLGATEESIKAEDAPAPPVAVAVELPTRRTTTDIVRSATGDITKVVQRETSEP